MADETTAAVATETAAPASTPYTPPIATAAHEAVAKQDTSAYREAKRAERSGKPLPAPVATETTPQQPVLSRKEREQLATNERVRTATEKAIADATAVDKAEIARLRALQPAAAPVAPVAPAKPDVAAVPEWKRIAALPDAPKIDDFESLGEHAAAMALFVNQTLRQEATAGTERDQLTAAQQTRVETFITRLNETKAADPEFVKKLTPEVKALKPFSALLPGEASGPRNVISEQIYDSPIAPKVLLHFSEHPEALQKLVALPPHIAALPPTLRAKAHTAWIVKEFGKLEGALESPAAPATPQPKTLTDAIESPQTLGSRPAEATDPKASAIRRGDTRAYREQRRHERAAALGR